MGEGIPGPGLANYATQPDKDVEADTSTSIWCEVTARSPLPFPNLEYGGHDGPRQCKAAINHHATSHLRAIHRISCATNLDLFRGSDEESCSASVEFSRVRDEDHDEPLQVCL